MKLSGLIIWNTSIIFVKLRRGRRRRDKLRAHKTIIVVVDIFLSRDILLLVWRDACLGFVWRTWVVLAVVLLWLLTIVSVLAVETRGSGVVGGVWSWGRHGRVVVVVVLLLFLLFLLFLLLGWMCLWGLKDKKFMWLFFFFVTLKSMRNDFFVPRKFEIVNF